MDDRAPDSSESGEGRRDRRCGRDPVGSDRGGCFRGHARSPIAGASRARTSARISPCPCLPSVQCRDRSCSAAEASCSVVRRPHWRHDHVRRGDGRCRELADRLGTAPIPRCRTSALAAKQLREDRIAFLWLRTHLIPGALLRILVGPETEEAGAVADALVLHLVVSDLAHQSRTDLVPREVLSLRPARPGVWRAPPFAGVELEMPGLPEWRKHLLQLLLKRRGDT